MRSGKRDIMSWKMLAMVWLRYLLILAWIGVLAVMYSMHPRHRELNAPEVTTVIFAAFNLLYLVFSTPWPRRPAGRLPRLVGLWLDAKENQLARQIEPTVDYHPVKRRYTSPPAPLKPKCDPPPLEPDSPGWA